METLSPIKGMEIFFEFFLKSSLILGLTLCAYFLAKKKSATFRHFLLSLSMLILLLLPALMAFAPTWRSNIIPWLSTDSKENSVTQVSEAAPKPVVPAEAGNISPTISLAGEVNDRSPLLMFLQDLYPYFVIALWPLGLFFLLSKLAFGLYGTFRITNRSITINGYPWKQLFLLFFKKTPLKRKIRLLKNDRIIIPMTWGVRKPVIMLPSESKDWSIAHCSTVLFHELSHIKRGDFLVRLLSMVSCSLYWFNPLIWIVFRQLKKEQEKACDEMVLKAGIKPSTYASCLLYMKKSIEKARGHFIPATAIGMAGKSEFKERLTTILKKQLIPKEEKMKSKITLLVLSIFAVALIGTAKPGKAPLPSDHEEAAVTQPAAVGHNSTAVTDEQEKKEKAEKKREKKEKKKCLKVRVEESESKKDKKGEKKFNIYISEDECNGKDKKKIKKIICLPGNADIEKIKIEGDHLIIYEKDKPVKKIKLERKGDGEGKKIVWVSKEGDKKFNIVTDEKKCKSKNVHVIMKKGKSTTCDEKELWTVKEEGGEGERVFKIKTGDKDGDLKTYKIKTKIFEDEELKKSIEDLKKSMKSIDKEFKAKSPGQVKVLKEMEEVLQKMEQELEKKEGEHKKVEVILEEDDHELLEIDEADEKIEIILEGENDELFFTSKDTSFHMEIKSSEKISKKQENQLKKAVAKLKKNLPKSYSVKSEITDATQSFSIKSGDESSEKIAGDTVMKEIHKFEEELEKILPGTKGKKTLNKNIWLKKKEEKKK
jgi:beta-lactamase regulating signal transducer with metallopeptidase domain